MKIEYSQLTDILTFIDSNQGVRRLSAENAAKHRQAIITGTYTPHASRMTRLTPIYTKTERQCMGIEVVKSVSNPNPTQALIDLGRFHQFSDLTSPFSFFQGPLSQH
jgi:hypothetical protein